MPSRIGRIFEGDAAMMLKSFDRAIELDDKTLIWPGNLLI